MLCLFIHFTFKQGGHKLNSGMKFVM